MLHDKHDSQNGKNSQNGKTTGNRVVATDKTKQIYQFMIDRVVPGSFNYYFFSGKPLPPHYVYLRHSNKFSDIMQVASNNCTYPIGELLKLFNDAGITFD